MKKVKFLPFALAAALITLLCVCVFGLTACSTGDSQTPVSSTYLFELEDYEITYDISKDCKIAVTEDLTVNYLGPQSTGFIRDIPADGGVQVRDVKVEKLAGSSPSFYYDVDYESRSFVSVDIGDYSYKYGKTEKYRLTYTYIITNSEPNGGQLNLNPVGHGWGTKIHHAKVKMILPDGFESAKCYYGRRGSTDTLPVTQTTENGRTVVSAETEKILPMFSGVTFNLNFEKGAIKAYFDFTPYIFLIIAGVLLLVTVVLKLFVLKNYPITPVVNYEAPNKMNPLLMGKLIDNKIDNEDVTSMLYYWASKGYIKINFDDNKNPTIIRIAQKLPQNSPAYEKILYEGLFKREETVTPAQLTGKYYTSVDKAKNILKSETSNLYRLSGTVLAFAFAVIAGLIVGLAPLLLGFIRVSSKLVYFPALFMIIPSIAVNLIGQMLVYTKYKFKKALWILSWASLALLCAAVAALYIFIPDGIMDIAPKILLSVFCMGTAAASSVLIARTEKYSASLGEILGFKEFIKLAQKNELETMLEENPQFYYEILPYAQVLGVSDIWEEKFKDITVKPPQWATGNLVHSAFTLYTFNRLINGSMRNMSRNMVSRPSSSGSNFGGGRGFGGHGGGFSGGGFGGGGGRGR